MRSIEELLSDAKRAEVQGFAYGGVGQTRTVVTRKATGEHVRTFAGVYAGPIDGESPEHFHYTFKEGL